MKYVVFLGDGMADYPDKELGGKTPLECAHKPNMDALAAGGELGLVRTVADDLKPGSDVANLSVLGYDPHECYTGRSPLEAASIGVELRSDDVTFRANLVTLSGGPDYADMTMADYSADEITTQEADELIKYLREHIVLPGVALYTGISYRHLLVHTGGSVNVELTPPHDISDKPIADYLPKGDNADMLLDIMRRSYELLREHPVNKARAARGLHPANSLWVWGEGTRPELAPFFEKYGVRGSMISAVDLLKGIGKCAGMRVVEVEGATGNIDTNFPGKAHAAIDELKDGQDFVYIHVEAPDECGHRHEVQNKVHAIELIDRDIIGPVWAYLKECGEPYRLLVTPDHPTPLAVRTHTRDAVPYAIYDSRAAGGSGRAYTEAAAAETGLLIRPGHLLMGRLLGKEQV